MPEAAARALLLAAQSAAPASGQTEHQDARQIAAPATPASETVIPTEPPAAAQSSPSPPATENPHGARLQGLAAARGVEDAELANLMRNAVAQGPIPAERARQALPIMLERVNEEIADRTVELLDMFYPPAPGQAENRPGRPETSTSVDFGALEPPQAA